ncbi:Endoribonuclease L-PSP [Dothidotthia symphoricarpi CBS 119687]|uniref:Endoribonuclease L-PSP n=1 Tax=Dothidotthia symphoricarpi CBS 119687 TaxID=1392245 RepID=A0A6A6A2F9_9PLEO|nr:Endoribonuclease L-PSP [Dothidotthia symphoricarpi CBS 119687]KAF2125385.1 Endoribonuclease L-PSP [Dothidotthia symphoricarpi CBS 119687]
MTSKKEVVKSSAQPQTLSVMPYSAAVKCNGMVYLSGNIGMDPKTKKLVEGDIKDRTRMIMTIITGVLKDSGSDIKNIVKCGVFLTDMANFTAMNEAYMEFFPDAGDVPARTCVQVAGLPLGTDIEIECIAHL